MRIIQSLPRCVLVLAMFSPQVMSAEDRPASGMQRLSYSVDLVTARKGFDGKDCWVHARAGAIPPGAPGNRGSDPLVIMTMQKLLLSGSDVFYSLNELRSADLGKTWSEPTEIPLMGRQAYRADQDPLPTGAKGFTQLLKDGDETIVCDFTPQWHPASQKLLGIGHTVWYRRNAVMKDRPRATAYAVRDSLTGQWNHWKVLEIPDEFPNLKLTGAGCVQRYDLPSGEILLPVYGHNETEPATFVTVLRCRFDGETMSVVSCGNLLKVPTKRGLAEPSLTRFGNRFYLTLRHDDRGYLSVSDDGLQYSEPRPWTFDDGSELGNYNTQQHWVTHCDGLFLVYTRKGANNDHVFRHRAPLFMGQVDPEKLCIIKETEQAIVPERGARLGNFGVVDVSQNETWVIAAEWMQPRPPKGMPESYGSDNSVFVSRIKWNRPNLLMK